MFSLYRSVIVTAICLLALGMAAAPSPVYADPAAESADIPSLTTTEDPVRGLAAAAVPDPGVRRLVGSVAESGSGVAPDSQSPECLWCWDSHLVLGLAQTWTPCRGTSRTHVA